MKTETGSATSAPHPRHGRRQRLARAAVLALLTAARLGGAGRVARAAQSSSDGPWAPATFMLQPRSESAIAQLDGRLYVLGGTRWAPPLGRRAGLGRGRRRWALGPPLPDAPAPRDGHWGRAAPCTRLAASSTAPGPADRRCSWTRCLRWTRRWASGRHGRRCPPGAARAPRSCSTARFTWWVAGPGRVMSCESVRPRD